MTEGHRATPGSQVLRKTPCVVNGKRPETHVHFKGAERDFQRKVFKDTLREEEAGGPASRGSLFEAELRAPCRGLASPFPPLKQGVPRPLCGSSLWL